MSDSSIKYAIQISFEEIKLPPFQDILILGRNSPQGKIGLSKSFELLIPQGFEVVEANDERVEAVFINKRIIKKIPVSKVIELLQVKVFPYISDGELLKVDFKINVSFAAFEENDL